MLAKAVLAALDAWPGSRQALADAADVPHTLLNRYAHDGVPCTPRVARKLARALRAHGAQLTAHAKRLEAQLKNMQ